MENIQPSPDVRSTQTLMRMLKVIDSAVPQVKLLRPSQENVFEAVNEYLSWDENVISLSKLEYPASAYKDIKRIMGLSNKEYHRVFSHTWRMVTMKDDKTGMHRSFSERLLLLLKIYVQGAAVFGTVQKTNRWLNRFNPALDTKPIDLVDTITGCHKVSDELSRIEHGLLA